MLMKPDLPTMVITYSSASKVCHHCSTLREGRGRTCRRTSSRTTSTDLSRCCSFRYLYTNKKLVKSWSIQSFITIVQLKVVFLNRSVMTIFQMCCPIITNPNKYANTVVLYCMDFQHCVILCLSVTPDFFPWFVCCKLKKVEKHWLKSLKLNRLLLYFQRTVFTLARIGQCDVSGHLVEN